MRRLTWLLAAILVTAACSSDPAPDPGPRFDNGEQAEITCMMHQPHAPGARYTDEALRRTDESMALLRYYTANGRKSYCDGAGPTDIDRSWIRLYVQLGADESNVASLIG
jgi:hypothetical protein